MRVLTVQRQMVVVKWERRRILIRRRQLVGEVSVKCLHITYYESPIVTAVPILFHKYEAKKITPHRHTNVVKVDSPLNTQKGYIGYDRTYHKHKIETFAHVCGVHVSYDRIARSLTPIPNTIISGGRSRIETSNFEKVSYL